MTTIEEFKNAPTGATATSPNGNIAIKTGKLMFEWTVYDHLGHIRDSLRSDEMGGYTLNPAAPTTAREALELVWDLAHPIKDGQQVDVGTRCIAKVKEGDLRTYRVLKPFIGGGMQGWAEVRTIDPQPEPDWLDAPAILAHCAYCSHEDQEPQTTLHGTFYNGRMWDCAECQTTTDWYNLRDVTPLWPKEDA